MTGGPSGDGPGAARTPAMGGARDVPVPDEIARDYLLLALRLDQHAPGLVDGYFGPADLKARVDIEPLRSPTALRDDAAALRARVEAEVVEADRRDWLTAQLTALGAQAAALAGAGLPYVELVAACFGWTPERRDEAVFDAAAEQLDTLLPGPGPLDERLAAWDEQFEIEPDALPAVVDWLVTRFRERADRLFGLPEGEDVRVSYVRGQPWTGYNWYEGGFRSRVDLNLDLPVRAPDLIHTIAHETYPGHHLEHAWKEAVLVEGARRLESSVLLINTPECLISEGLADLGVRFAAPADEADELFLELFDRAGLPLLRDPAVARHAAATTVAMREPRRRLAEARVNAALLRHADGVSRDEALAYLRRVGRLSEPLAAKRLQFIEHPLWRTYVFVYHEGEALLRRWLAVVPDSGAAGRFGRLLREQLTPAAIAAESAAGAAAPGSPRALP